MKSIYSLEVLQRIIDHWGIGKIEDVTYFEKVGRNIWRHHIETNQGTFELYSYPVENREYAKKKLKDFLTKKLSIDHKELEKKKTIHSFDRYHVILQFTKKYLITIKQASKDLDLLIGSTIEKALRVYGTILQIHLNESDVNTANVLVSYGSWNIQDYEKGRANVLVKSSMQNYKKLDTAIEIIEKDKPTIEKYILKEEWFELYLSNGTSWHFVRSGKFPAIEIHLKSRKNDIHIFEEDRIFYTKNLRE